jgi:branched-chain amino acid transport system ATP-binding protein
MMLSVRNLKVWYGRTEIVRDVSFDVGAGAVVALMGGNGAGKTTVLRALSGLVRPRAGTIMFDGQAMAGREPRDMVLAGLVQVPQGRFVWPGMSVAENLELGAVTRKRGERAACFERVNAIFPTLAVKREAAAGSLSGGEQQMLAVGRALMAAPRMLLMDEPSAGLSPKVVDEMVAAITRLKELGLSILLVEQNVGVAGALAGTAHILANGAIAMSVDGAALGGDPQVARSYFGR